MNALNQELLDTWIDGWSLCRGYQVVRTANYVYVDKGVEAESQREYFLLDPEPHEIAGVVDVARADVNPLLCIVTSELSSIHHYATEFSLDVVQTQESFMVVDMDIQDVEKPRMPWDRYEQRTESDAEVGRIFITHNDVDIAHGSVAVLGNTAIYDRISTNPEFRRQGLATYVMRALTALALEQDEVESGLLIASTDGRLLYQALGWRALAAVATLKLSGRAAQV